MKFVKTFILFIAMILLSVTWIYAKAAYSKTEGKTCTHCHTKAGSKDLNDVGNCYAKNHKLEGCKAPERK
ncbi:MAG: hypothetical protein PHX83_06490 [Acidobacteriia bacterium]|nr:hypothetical protein [Terriglobia bacterium]